MMKTVAILMVILAAVGGEPRGLRGTVFPSRELAMLARIGDYERYEQLFLSLEYDPADSSVQEVIQMRDDIGASQVDIECYGLNLLSGVAVAAATQLSGAWTGKVLSFATSDRPDLGSYKNIVFGKLFWTGVMYADSFVGSMLRNGESDPGDSLPAPADKSPMVLDGKQSLILDYIPGDLGAVLPLLEECRPLTKAALLENKVFVGRRIDSDKLKDVYLCRSANRGPGSDERTFALHFAFQLDRDTIQFTGSPV